MYLEDVDLAWRAQASGWRCLYVPSARVYHAHSASAVEGSPFKNCLKGRNKIWLVAKNYPWPQIAYWAPLLLLYDLMGVAATSSKGDLAPLRGRVAALRRLGKIIEKRDSIRASDAAWQLVRPRLSGLATPWGVRRRYSHLGARVRSRP
jgi:GT2 family glycosyltransferase